MSIKRTNQKKNGSKLYMKARTVPHVHLKKINKEFKLDGADVDRDFRDRFGENLKQLCKNLTSGYIGANRRKIKGVFDSCEYCA